MNLKSIYEEASGALSRGGLFDKEKFILTLEQNGCLSFIESEIKTFTDSSNTGRLGVGVRENLMFLQGSVFGYVFAKTGDRALATKAGSLAAEKAQKVKSNA